MTEWNPRAKIVDWNELLAIRERSRQMGRVVVWTNGCFDLLHPGHLSSLQSARQLGDILIVGLNSDASVRTNKGPTRPVLNQLERATMLAGLECVDYVIIFDETTPEVSLRNLQPDIHCKGAEYAPPNGRAVPERELVESYGGRIEYLPLVPGVSSTDIIDRIANRNEVRRAA
jgi:rfaE bifunctional protein nucleotidyltransferase chain/domain